MLMFVSGSFLTQCFRKAAIRISVSWYYGRSWVRCKNSHCVRMETPNVRTSVIFLDSV